MLAEVAPVLADLRALYDIHSVMPRFHAYKALFAGETRGEPIPIGQFSPMGRRQPAYLDALIAIGAEDIAAATAREACARLPGAPGRYRLALVVVDEPANGWTERWLTDAQWRFGDPDELPRAWAPRGFDRWVSVQLWTDTEPTAAHVRGETLAALYRAAHRRAYGRPATLDGRLEQEGRALAFAGDPPTLPADDLEYTRVVLAPLLGEQHYPTAFAALYGDEAARAAGYAPLGLSRLAGLALGAHDASRSDPAAALAGNAALTG